LLLLLSSFKRGRKTSTKKDKGGRKTPRFSTILLQTPPPTKCRED